MSDEDRDIDIESDEDDELGANTQFMTQAEKRAHHNALERKRRDHIKESFHSLRDSIPSLQGEKVNTGGASKSSRAQILKQATDYIQFMCKKNSAHQHDIEDLKRQNNLLDQQVRLFEKTKAAGTFAASQSGGSDGSTSSGSKSRGGGASAQATSSDRLKHQDQSDSSDSETESRQRRKKLKT